MFKIHCNATVVMTSTRLWFDRLTSCQRSLKVTVT